MQRELPFPSYVSRQYRRLHTSSLRGSPCEQITLGCTILPAMRQGHTHTVEDLVWQPRSAAELASVGDDYKLLFWDIRAGTSPAASLENAHGEQDLHCVDWSSLQLEMLVTGMPFIALSAEILRSIARVADDAVTWLSSTELLPCTDLLQDCPLDLVGGDAVGQICICMSSPYA